MEEIWKDTIGIENYKISNLGRIKSKSRFAQVGYGKYRSVEERILIPDSKGRVYLNGHIYNVKSLWMQNFPDVYTSKFIKDNTLPGEEWKDIKNYEGYYKVSSFGRVMSLPRCMGIRNMGTYMCPARKLGSIRKPAKIGKKDKYGDNREQVLLRKDGKSEYKLINRLVAEAFIPNPDNLEEVNHKNKDFRNNRVENLEWVSSLENKKHAYIDKYSIISLYTLANKEGVTPTKMLDILIENYTSNH